MLRRRVLWGPHYWIVEPYRSEGEIGEKEQPKAKTPSEVGSHGVYRFFLCRSLISSRVYRASWKVLAGWTTAPGFEGLTVFGASLAGRESDFDLKEAFHFLYWPVLRKRDRAVSCIFNHYFTFFSLLFIIFFLYTTSWIQVERLWINLIIWKILPKILLLILLLSAAFCCFHRHRILSAVQAHNMLNSLKWDYIFARPRCMKLFLSRTKRCVDRQICPFWLSLHRPRFDRQFKN